MSDLDLQRVLREIDDEVRARRASGDFPPGLERDLDLTFARFAPASVSGEDLDGLVEAADRASFFDADPPTASRLPGVSFVKRVQRKAFGWFFRYLAQQTTAFAGVVVSALRLLGRRLDRLERLTAGANRSLLEIGSRAQRPATVGSAADVVAAHLAGSRGRVLLAEAGDGALLRRMVEGGLDAYGVEPDLERAEAAALGGLEVRADDVVDHLHAVDDGSLAALVLVGIVDRAPLGVQVELVEQAARVLPAGGRLVVVGTPPSRWGADDPVEADLSPGRPLHAATWVHLLEGRGFSSVAVDHGDQRFAVAAVR